MAVMICGGANDVVYKTLSQSMFTIFQADKEVRNIVIAYKDAREQAARHFFQRAQRAARDG